MTVKEKEIPIPAVLAPSVQEPIVFLEEDEDFDALYEESVKGFHDQDIVSGTVTEITRDYVTVDICFKSDCLIAVNEFQNSEGVLEVEVGDTVDVYVEALEADEDGITYLSKRKAEKVRTWEKIGDIYEEDGIVRGTIVARIKGGLSVDIGVKAFLPGSQVDLRPVRNLDKLLGEDFDFKVLKFNQKRGNIVLSRRVLLEIDRDEKRLKTLEILQEGALINGYIKNITDYGVFVDLGGVDGLLHITDMTWGRIVHPSEMFEIGDEVEVVVLKYFPEDQKVSLGLKQKAQNPWEMVEEKFAVGTKVSGKIVSLTDYGAFIEIEPGVEGLIHVSEMSWTKRVRHPSKVVELGQMVEAVVKDLDVERKRISLSIKEVQVNPWKLALDRYPVGCIVKGSVRNVTDFGIFIGLDEGIDGLVHVSDISWKQRQCKPSEIASKGDEIEVKVLNIDVDQERLSLGIKQLTDDPWNNLDEKSPLGSDITGTVVNLTDFGIFVEVSDGVEGLVHISEVDSSIPKNKVHDMYAVGSVVKANVIKIDLEERRLGLSIIEIISSPTPDPSASDIDSTEVTEAKTLKEEKIEIPEVKDETETTDVDNNETTEAKTTKVEKDEEKTTKVEKDEEKTAKVEKDEEKTAKVEKDEEKTAKVEKDEEKTAKVEKGEEKTTKVEKDKTETKDKTATVETTVIEKDDASNNK
ncbi:MAG TPA: 30S ribosomal protein S1 [SAR324 cluster bacterium]|nr:30S ribosomal protein S1 [SAR324 cluster bacterium]